MRIPQRKLAVPELPAAFAPRPHLLDLLDGATGGQLIVVIAPPGYGKTVLLADWLRRPGGPSTGWITVDAQDDGARFRSALLTAFAAMPDLPPDSPLREIGREAASQTAPHLDDLVAALDGTRPAVRLILDDLHELAAPEALRDLARLVRHRPAGLQLVLASRMDPALPLPRLRLEGRLHELRADTLRFTADDTAALMRASGLDLTAAQLAVLHARTDGWVAGLRFAALALRSSTDPQAFIERFSGSERSVADYLTGEVMASLSVQDESFLRVSAVCSLLPVDLAVALSGRPDAGRVLDELTRGIAPVQRTDPGTYSIHTLLRTYLATDLERHLPALHRRSHTTAARWWLAADDPVHALRHAERAGEPALLLELLRASGVQLFAAGRIAAVRRALDAVGSGVVAADPWAALLAALVHSQERALPEAVAALARARRIRTTEPDPALETLRTSVELLATRRRQPGGRADIPPGPVPVELDALLQLALAAAATGAAGADLDDIRARLERVASLSREHGFAYFEVRALSLLAVLEAVNSRHAAMKAAASSAVEAAVKQGRDPADWTADASALIAYWDLLAADPDAAKGRAEAVLGAGVPLPVTAELTLRVVHGAALCDLGECASGLAACRAARAELGDAQVPVPLIAALAMLEHRAALAQGGRAFAAGTAEWLERRLGKVGELLVMDAWERLFAGQYQAAGAAVEPLRAGSVPPAAAHTSVEAHLVLAETALQDEDPRTARGELAAALALGSDLDVVRPFALTGGRTGELLRSAVPAGVSSGFARRLTAARSVLHAEVHAPLSERELAVLELLPSMLSAGEIADELTVSVNTVKSHIRSIYGKLRVSSRRAAVRRAQERNLLL